MRSSLFALFLLAPSLWAAELQFNDEGVQIDGESMGKFTLGYPSLLGVGSKVAHKLIEKSRSAQSATLTYEGHATLRLDFEAGGKVHLKAEGLPADVKAIGFEMHLPIAFNQGGSWMVAGKASAFPKEKPATPHLFQGHAASLSLSNYEGKTLLLEMPEHSFLQLIDNREWSWDIFNFTSMTPLASNSVDWVVSFKTIASNPGVKLIPIVDQFGQLAAQNWPGKVKDLAELKADVETEQATEANHHPPQFDPFGGLPGSKARLGLKATNFFHLEKSAERWLLVDPIGNAYFHLGVCGVNPSDDFTQIEGREAAYAWLPSRTGEFQTVFRPGKPETVSFHLANTIRKYGKPYDSNEYTARMISRMRRWGFNSIGAFSTGGEAAREAAQMPTVAFLPLAQWDGIKRIPNIHETFDPFDQETRMRVDRNCSTYLPAHASDSLIVGYFIVNEPLYEKIPTVLPSLDGTFACKRRLVEWLEAKYQTLEAFNSAWESSAKSFQELQNLPLPVQSQSAREDMTAFTGVFLEAYFRLINETFHRYDSNHLLIGSRLQPGTINNEQLCRIAGKYLDVMSFNYYTFALEKDFLRQVHRWTGGRPMMLSEFYWASSAESGLSGGRELATQQERGLAYRNYVEQGATLDFVVGIEWFTLVDQAVTGRWFEGFNGERANTGLISVGDRPWSGMLSEMVKTNYDIYKVLFGERPPYAFADPRFLPRSTPSQVVP